MKAEVAWQSEREAIDALLNRVRIDPDLKRMIGLDPDGTIRRIFGPGVGIYPVVAKPNPCGPLKTSCPPGKTCGNKVSCKVTEIKIEDEARELRGR
ncbi:MAG TPA: hypothetical protein VMH81_01805 [Bryobacteraceae bacterium]|nr:hypothetical protein [Bryobacteraceae bacterium]